MNQGIQYILELRINRDIREKALTYFTNSDEQLNELTQLATTTSEYPIQEYSSWLLIHCVQTKKEFLNRNIQFIIDGFIATENHTVTRNLCNVLYKLELSEYRESELLDRLTSLLLDRSQRPAVHVYCLYNLINFCTKYPELLIEVNSIVELFEEHPIPPSISVALRKYKKAFYR